MPAQLPTLRGHRYEFELDHYEGRYWNTNGYPCAVIASIGVEGAWAAYIGGCDPQNEDEGLKFVAAYGAKLSEKDARHFFPELAEMPYRE